MIRRLLASVGVLCLIPIGEGLLHGGLSVFAAAQRALVLLGIIWLLERFVVPFIVALAFSEGAALAQAEAAARAASNQATGPDSASAD